LDDRGYENLLASRVALQRFLRWSQEQAAVAGLTTAQHQLLLVLRIHPDPPSPTIGELASYLLIRHHSTVQLTDRVNWLGPPAAAGHPWRAPGDRPPRTRRPWR
jgi:hypothetical protein